MNIKDRLLAIKDSVHSIEIGEDKYFFKHLKGEHNQIISQMKDEDINCVAFILSLCDEKGAQVFELEELDIVKTLPRLIVNVISNAAMMGNEAKPLGV